MLEQIIALIAPHTCLHCNSEGSLLCIEGIAALPSPSPHCLSCGAGDTLLCRDCNTKQYVDAIFASTPYSGVAKTLVAKLKFERAKAAAVPIAHAMFRELPSNACTLVHIPTASQRVRLRGYDQAALIAARLSRLSGIPHTPLLHRAGQKRQLGQSRRIRELQLHDAFYVSRPAVCRNQTFLLIDDVVTTGSTLQAAAHALKSAGASKVGALVFAVA